jgi:hypothetical protein
MFALIGVMLAVRLQTKTGVRRGERQAALQEMPPPAPFDWPCWPSACIYTTNNLKRCDKTRSE